MFEVGFAEAAVAGPAASGDGDGLAYGTLDPGPALVVFLPVFALLPGPDGSLQFVQVTGQDRQLPAVAAGGGAQLAGRAGTAGGDAEPDDDPVVAFLPDGGPAGAGLALGAGDGAGVVVDGEGGPVVAIAGAGLAEGIGGQRGDQGDPEQPGRVQHVARRAVSRVEVVPARARSLRASAALTGVVISAPATDARVVATPVIRFGRTSWPHRPDPAVAGPGRQPQAGGSSQVSEMCSLYPGQDRSFLPPQRAPAS